MRKMLINAITVSLEQAIDVLWSKPKLTFLLLADKIFLRSPSYYPEKRRKSKSRIVWDNVKFLWKHGRIEEFYFAYGLDVVGVDVRNYIDYKEFMLWRDKLNRLDGKPYEYTGLLRDKFVFNLFTSGIGFPSSSMVGIISGEQIFLIASKKEVYLKDFFNTNTVDVFCKAIDAEDGRSIFRITNKDGVIAVNGKKIVFEELIQELGDKRWTIEHRIEQHPAYGEFHPLSVNTLRIYTVRDVRDGLIKFLPSIFRVGVGGNNVDNWARGGLIIRLYEDGVLGKYGYYRPAYGTKVDRHPDTGIVFEGVKLPFAAESFDLVKKMHEYLYGIHSIGWDVAITENGPIIVEANDNWEISATQIPSHGCQKEFDMYFKGQNK